mmetsp:Transcript_19243/g.52866  ORF Transcript_19243/g.52866 Transcript_19243/m.52866 type:complete len:294 (+) Transcript_19243:134-1015(+)
MSKATAGKEESVLRQDEDTLVLEPLVQAAQESKDSNVATIRSIVMKVLTEPKLFAGYDQIKAILQDSLSSAGAEGAKLSHSLDLFSYGTFSDYQSDKTKYLDLTGAQLLKLRQLTALTVVQHACVKAFQSKGGTGAVALISYQEFAEALQLPNVAENSREVEDILVSCLYMGVFRGKLCQQSRSLHLSARHPIRPRDVPVSQIPVLAEQIRGLLTLLQSAQSNLDQKKQNADVETRAMAAFWKQVDERKKKNESAAMMRWDQDVDVGGGSTRRQKRGRAAASGDGGNFPRFPS